MDLDTKPDDEPIVPDVEDAEEEPTEDEESSDDAGESSEDGDQDNAQPPSEEPTPTATSDTRVLARLRELELENQYLKGEREASKRTAVAPNDEDEEDDDEPDDVVRAALERDAVRTIKSREQKLIAKVLKQVQKELDGREEKIVGRTQAVTQDERERQIEIAAMREQYPELWTDETFKDRATNLYHGLIRQFGGDKPGLQLMATTTAYGQMVREGRLTVAKPSNSNGAAKVAQRRTIDPGIKSPSRPATKTRDPFDGFDASERASIEKTCRQLGITPEKFRRNFDLARKEDKGYGARS